VNQQVVWPLYWHGRILTQFCLSAGVSKPASRSRWPGVGGQVFPSLHGVGVQERARGKHDPRDPAHQPWQRRLAAQVAGHQRPHTL